MHEVEKLKQMHTFQRLHAPNQVSSDGQQIPQTFELSHAESYQFLHP